MSDIIEVIKDVTTVTIASDGPQGPAGPTGPTGPEGAAGAPGSSGVISVVAPITNTGTSTSAIIGINAGVANGVATLDSGGKVPQSQIPAVAITNTFVVASQAAMLALTAEEGDVAVRTDQNKTYILTATPSSTLANWQELLTPTDTVTSVDGRIGTVTLTDKYAQLATANTFTGGVQQITTASDTTKGLIVKALSSGQSVNLQEWQDSSGNNLAAITNQGAIKIGPSISGIVAINNNLFNSAIPLSIRGISGQTANLQEWQNSSGTVLFSITSAGAFGNQVTAGAGIDVVGGGNALRSIAGAATVVPIVSKGATSQTAALQQWQNSAGTVLASVSASGDFTAPINSASSFFNLSNATGGLAFSGTYIIRNNGTLVNIGPNTTTGAQLTVTNQTAANVGLIVKGTTSQTANLQEWQNSAGTIVAKINQVGSAVFGNATINAAGNLNAYASTTTTIPMVVRGAASQTADLQQWQDSTGAISAKVDFAGFVTASAYSLNSGLATLYEESSGGRLRLTRATAVMSNPGANIAKFYLRDGTVSGTLKFVVRAGAAGAETTILDNIPQ
jgi:hypothetical protein